MAEQDAARVAEEVWVRLGAGDWQGARSLMHERYVQEWPQSGERIVGPDDALAVDQNFPGGLPKMVVRRAVGSGDLGLLEVRLGYADGSVYDCVSIVELLEGKIVKETDYFAQPFDPPQWRAQWVERM
jgi:hypothetical protein